jgi:hypothetical protein
MVAELRVHAEVRAILDLVLEAKPATARTRTTESRNFGLISPEFRVRAGTYWE